MSQRQVLQGKARGGRRPDGLAAGAAGAPGRPAPPCLSSAVFEQYQKARTQFVQMVAELATRPQNIETLQNAGEPAPIPRRSGPLAPLGGSLRTPGPAPLGAPASSCTSSS